MKENCDTNDFNNCCKNTADVLTSIALQEAALAHILNAEGEKIQKAVASEKTTIGELLCINSSVEQTLQEVTRLEIVLTQKLQAALKCPTPPRPEECQGKVKICIQDCESKRATCGVQVRVKDENGKIIASDLTGCEGCVCFCLPCGKYTAVAEFNETIKEKKFEITQTIRYVEIIMCFEIPIPPPPVQVTVTVCGKVVDYCGRALAGAEIIIEGHRGVAARTDKCGNYCLTLKGTPSVVRLQGVCNGKKSITSVVYIGQAREVRLNFAIR